MPRNDTTRPRWIGWEWLLLAATTLGLLATIAWPTYRAPRLSPTDAEFIGVAVGVRDAQFYLSLVRQEVGLSPLLANPFAEPGNDRIFWGVFWWALAHVRQLTGASAVEIFHLARYAAAIWCVLAFAWYATVATGTRLERWIGIQCATWGGGLGWLVMRTGWNNYESADLLTPEATAVYTALGFPHLTGALALLVAGFAVLVKARSLTSAWPWGWCGCAIAFGLGIFHPFNVLVLLGAWGLLVAGVGVHGVEHALSYIRTTWPMILGGVLAVAYFVVVVVLYPEGLPETVVRRPGYVALLLGFGLLWLGPVAYWVSHRSREWITFADMVAVIWILATVLLLHSYPILKQEGRAILGLHVPLALLGARAVGRLSASWPPKAQVALAVSAILAAVPTGFAITADRTDRLENYPGRFYQPAKEAASMRALADKVDEDDRIACAPWSALLMAPTVPAHFLVGKWDEPTYAAHESVLQELFGEDTSAQQRHALIDRHGITVLWISETERGLYPSTGISATVAALGQEVLLDDGQSLAIRVAR